MYLKKLIESEKTVFSLMDLGKIWKIEDKNYLKLVASRLSKRGEIIRIKKGLYALRDSYSRYELANRLKKPSYISLETVLQKEGIIFQDYSKTITSISNNTLSKEVDGYNFEYFKIKDEVFSNSLGVKMTNQISIASLERAVCDRAYLSPGFYFDNLRGMNKKELIRISKIYSNKRVEKEIFSLAKDI